MATEQGEENNISDSAKVYHKIGSRITMGCVFLLNLESVFDDKFT